MAATAKSGMTDYDPRTRLVGAVVLVVIAIIFLPMLFGPADEAADDERDTGNSVVMEITSEGKKVFVSRIAPIEDVPVADSAALGLTNTEKQIFGRKSDAATVQSKPEAKKTAPKKVVKPAESTSSKSDSRSQSALIRPMYVAPAKKADTGKKKATAPVKTASVKKSTPPAKSTSKTAAPAKSGYMVQVGSYSNKSNADKAAGK
jgi:cell division septation protein DedD